MTQSVSVRACIQMYMYQLTQHTQMLGNNGQLIYHTRVICNLIFLHIISHASLFIRTNGSSFEDVANVLCVIV